MGVIVGTGTAGTLTSGVSDIMSVVSTMMDTITGNPILLAAFCIGIASAAIGLAKKLVKR